MRLTKKEEKAEREMPEKSRESSQWSYKLGVIGLISKAWKCSTISHR